MKVTLTGYRFANFKRVPSESGHGFRSVSDGWTTADFVVEVDPIKLVAALGGKAVRSKSKRSRLQGTAIEVRAINVSQVKD